MTATEALLAELEAGLAGPRRVRRELLREVADHLEDATDAYRRAGYDTDEAATLAARDFGTAAEVAPALQETLALASSRRTAALLLAALAPQPFLWDGGLDLAGGRTAPDGMLYAVLDGTVEVGGAVVLLGSLLALLATGIGHRWLTVGTPAARLTARFAVAATVFVPVVGMAMTLLSGGDFLSWAVVLGCMVLPLGLAGWSALRTLGACAAPTARTVAPAG